MDILDRTPEHRPQGALPQPDGSVLWRIWAPRAERLSLVIWLPEHRGEVEMVPDGCGYFTHREPCAGEGTRYALKLGPGREYPDPASRWQPEGVHRPSAVFSLESHVWSDAGWGGIPRQDLVIYELHVGAFTPEGTFAAIIPRLRQLAALGVTAVELMPVAQFPGQRNWGYDGVHPYAVQNSYGGPRALQRFIDAAHGHGLGVILDVVYNHFGPEGNYLARFGPYLTDRYHTPWGEAVNFDGPESDAVRRFVIDNALMWVRDFHADGLRLDAVHAIYDFSARHILAELQDEVQEEAARQKRLVQVIAESDSNDSRLVRSPRQGGCGLDAAWSDDFHHSVHALLTGQRHGYYQDFGRPEQLAKAFAEVFVYDGCYSRFRRRRHGNSAAGLEPARFVVCVQNHDQVGNQVKGDRFGTMLSPAAQRLAAGLLLLSPYVPLLLMGEEYGETAPFSFFCSFADADLIEAVRGGRRGEFAARAAGGEVEIPDPQSPATFAAAKLRWAWPDGSPQARLRQLYADLLAARRQWPALRERGHAAARVVEGVATGVPDGPPALLVLERGADGELLAVANLGASAAALPASELAGRQLILSTEDARYGGSRRASDAPALLLAPEMRLLAHEMLIFRRSQAGP